MASVLVISLQYVAACARGSHSFELDHGSSLIAEDQHPCSVVFSLTLSIVDSLTLERMSLDEYLPARALPAGYAADAFDMRVQY